MAEILGIGCTHYPPGLVPDQYKPWPLSYQLAHDPRVPERLKDPANWPAPMRAEWGDDEGITSHAPQRKRVYDAFRILRAEIDAFKPDLIVMWGDDQYENFKEDIIPPFCVQAYDELVCDPFHKIGKRPNVWGEPNDKIFRYPGHREAGKYITRRLLEGGIDMPYAYRPRTAEGVGHAFANTLLYLDWDRRGIDYPVVPISVNAYGKRVISFQGGIMERTKDIDPPSPSPARCFEMGRQTARALAESPWRVVLMGSSSWSHAFLCDKHHGIHPDMEADRVLLEQLKSGEYHRWRDLTTDWIEDTGEQEFLSWIALGGAMSELGKKAQIVDWVETWVFNASKCFAVFR